MSCKKEKETMIKISRKIDECMSKITQRIEKIESDEHEQEMFQYYPPLSL